MLYCSCPAPGTQQVQHGEQPDLSAGQSLLSRQSPQHRGSQRAALVTGSFTCDPALTPECRPAGPAASWAFCWYLHPPRKADGSHRLPVPFSSEQHLLPQLPMPGHSAAKSWPFHPARVSTPFLLHPTSSPHSAVQADAQVILPSHYRPQWASAASVPSHLTSPDNLWDTAS